MTMVDPNAGPTHDTAPRGPSADAPASGAPSAPSAAAGSDTPAGPQTAKSGPFSPSSPLASLFGLAVIWGSFYLIVLAQNISSNEIHLDTERTGPVWGGEALTALDVRVKVRMPVDEFVLDNTSPRRIIKGLLHQAGITVEDSDLEWISDEEKYLNLTKLSLHAWLHAVIDDPEVGFSLRAREAQFFKQVLKDTTPPVGPLRQFDWTGKGVQLAAAPTIIFPSSNRSDLWFLFRLLPPGNGSTQTASVIEVEIRRGEDRRLAILEGLIGADGKATFSFAAAVSLLITIETSEPDRKVGGPGASQRPAPSAKGTGFDIRIFFQDHTANEPITAEEPGS